MISVIAGALGVIIIPTASGVADVAVAANPATLDDFLLGPQFTAGWSFTVGAPMSVTHLGLFDKNANGFGISYALALWSAEGDPLINATMPAGAAAAYEQGFRYVPVEESSLVLTPGETYVVGYYASTLSLADAAIHSQGSHTMHPLVQQVGGALVTSQQAPGITMPDAAFDGFDVWFGAGFKFQVVPAPGSMALMFLATIAAPRRQRAA